MCAEAEPDHLPTTDDGDTDGTNTEVGQLRAECDRLARRVAELETVQVIVGRPVLNVPDETLMGYVALEQEERRFTVHALTQHRELVLAWYRHLALFHEAIDMYGNRVTSVPKPIAHVLRLRLIAAAGGTAKLVLDATLAGYYTQALALVRHLFETWIRLEYLRLNPAAADRWFVADDGTPPRPPKEQTIHGYLLNRQDYALRPIVAKVIRIIRALNVMAHPSQNTLQQTKGVRSDQITVGANYDPDLCVKTLHEGCNAFRLIMTALGELLDVPAEWRTRHVEATREADSASLLEVERRKARQSQSINEV